MARAALLGLLVGCGTDGDSGDGTPTPTDETGTDGGGTPTPTDDTGTPTAHTGSGPDTTSAGPLAVACEPTVNALRFSCRVTVDPPAGVELRYAKADGSSERLVASEAVAAVHTIPVWFLAPGTVYRVEATTIGGSEVAETELTSGSPPADVAASLTVTGTSTTPYVGTNLPCGAGPTAGVFDTATGELLWYQVMDTTGDFNGMQMLQFTEDHTVLGQTGQHIVEVDLMGEDLLRKPYTDDFNHDLYRRNGKTWILYSDQIGALKLDGFVVWDADGNEVSRWFEEEGLPVPPTATGDWAHTNSVWVDEQENVLLSLHTQDTVLKLDASGDLQWVLAGAANMGLGQDFAVDWSAVPGVDAFSAQHNAAWRADGRLQILDNDNGRGLVLSVDEGGRTATVDEAFATSQARCGPQGTTTDTAAGGTLVGCSGNTLREYAPGSTSPAWSAALACESGGGGGGGPGGGLSFGAVRWYALDGW